MKIAYIDKFGGPEIVRIKDVPKPIPKQREVLVRVKAAAVTAADNRIRSATFPKGFGLFARLAFGFRKPRIKVLGNTFSGIVDAVGSDVRNFKPGDEVCGATGFKMGTHAEYIVVGESKKIIQKPQAVSHEQAAGVLFGGLTALGFLRDKAKVKKGESVLVNGASGAVGTNALQLAKYYGAEVTAVCSDAHTSLVKTLGADHVVNYSLQPISELGDTYDVVFDAVGNIGIPVGKKLLKPNGRLLLVVASLGEMIRSRGQVKSGSAPETKADCTLLIDLVGKGQLQVVIDSEYDLDQIAAAHERVNTGHKSGNVVVRL